MSDRDQGALAAQDHGRMAYGLSPYRTGESSPRADRVANQRVAVVINPVAGNGRGLRALPAVGAALAAAGVPSDIHVTTAAGDATQVSARFARDGFDLIIAVGGDGTVNEVANGLLDAGGGATLGVVAAGRGADFARNLGIPRPIGAAVARALAGPARTIDIGLVTFADGTSRCFVNAAGLGFDAAATERAAGSRLPGSTLPYLHGIFGALAGYRNLEVAIVADGVPVAGLVCLALVANGPCFGGGMRIAPGALLDDGLLDLAIVGDVSRRELLRNLPGIYRGRHAHHPAFTHLRARSIRIETPTPARLQIDGDLIGATPVGITIRSSVLRVVA